MSVERGIPYRQDKLFGDLLGAIGEFKKKINFSENPPILFIEMEEISHYSDRPSEYKSLLFCEFYNKKYLDKDSGSSRYFPHGPIGGEFYNVLLNSNIKRDNSGNDELHSFIIENNKRNYGHSKKDILGDAWKHTELSHVLSLILNRVLEDMYNRKILL